MLLCDFGLFAGFLKLLICDFSLLICNLSLPMQVRQKFAAVKAIVIVKASMMFSFVLDKEIVPREIEKDNELIGNGGDLYGKTDDNRR